MQKVLNITSKKKKKKNPVISMGVTKLWLVDFVSAN